MHRKKRASVLVAAIVLSLSASLINSSSAMASTSYVEGTDAAAAMFNPLQVNNFSMQMSQKDFDSMRYPSVSWDNEGDWRETRMSFTMAGKTYGPYAVGVHLKGAWGSWRDVSGKAAFKIKMDAFVKGQTLFGISRITLNNMVQDQSYLRESVSYRLYRNLGIPSPRTGFANVSLNGIDYGLHLNVETLNKQMLKRWNVSSAHLYKGAVPYFPDLYRGSEWMFAIESGSKTDVTDLSTFMAINELDGQAWWEAISARMDMNLMTLGWASEIYTGHWDGYVRNLNNYFINFDNDGKVQLLPWGVDQTWGGALGYSESRGVMPIKCWAYAPCMEVYRQSLAKVSRIARNLQLQTMARSMATAIRADVVKDPFGPSVATATAYQNNLVWRIGEQQRILTAMVQPYDTTLASVRVDGKIYSPGEQIYLEPGTVGATVQVTPNQASAIAAVRPLGVLKPGFNTVSVQVTSANRQHVNTTNISIYVFGNFTTLSNPIYNLNSAVPTFSATSNIGLLGTSVLGSQTLTLDIKMAKAKSMNVTRAKSLMTLRVRHLLASLAARGIKPNKVTQNFTTSGSINVLQITAKYRK